MAKKDKKNDTSDKGNSAGAKIKIAIVTILIVLVWLAIFGLLIKLDVGGFGSAVLRPVLKDVPIINKILPPATDEETAQETLSPYKTLEAALARIDELEKELLQTQESGVSNATGLNSQIEDLQKEVERLNIFEENQSSFEETKQKFYEDIVYNDKAPDTSEYLSWYEEIEPEKAAEIYQQIQEKIAADEDILNMAATYESMKPAQAASILQNMTGDLDTVAEILNNLSEKQRADILGSMDTAFAAKITTKMMP